MERMPVEILHYTLSHLAAPDLVRVAISCRSLWSFVRPLLYQNLHINLRSGDPDLATRKLLRALAREPRLRQLIRHVAVENEASTFWTAGHSCLLTTILSTWIECPEQIRSFSWKATRPFTDAHFPNLVHLECTSVRSRDEVDWIQWHLAHCSHLQSLSIGSFRRLSQDLSSSLFSVPSAPLWLHTLSLTDFDLSDVNPAVAIGPYLRSLQLQYCYGMDAFFSEVVRLGLAPELRSFRIMGIMSMALLQDFVYRLGRTSQLEELTLCIGSTLHPICLHCIETHAPALKVLVLDFRVVMQDIETAVQYSAAQFEDILARFPRLTSLGLPLQLRDPSSVRYKRAKFKRQGLHTKALRTLHIRRRCNPLKRFERDAKHAAALFPHRSGFTVFLDQGQRLRKIVFGTQYPSESEVAIADAERESLSAEF